MALLTPIYTNAHSRYWPISIKVSIFLFGTEYSFYSQIFVYVWKCKHWNIYIYFFIGRSTGPSPAIPLNGGPCKAFQNRTCRPKFEQAATIFLFNSTATSNITIFTTKPDKLNTPTTKHVTYATTSIQIDATTPGTN